MGSHHPHDPSPEEQLSKLKQENALLSKRLARANSKLAIYASLRRGAFRIILLTIFGSRFERTFTEMKVDLTRILVHLQRGNYQLAYDELRRVEPGRAYKLIEAFVVWRYRPRLFFLVAGGLITLLTTFLLYQQNQLIGRQNDLVKYQGEIALKQTDLIKVQADTTQMQAVSNILSTLDPDNPSKNQIAITQLAEYGGHSFDALVRLTEHRTEVSYSAMEALLGQYKVHSPEQVLRTLTALRVLTAEEMYSQKALGLSEKIASLGARVDTYFTQITSRCIGDDEFRRNLEERVKSQIFEVGFGLGAIYVAYNRYLVSSGYLGQRGERLKDDENDFDPVRQFNKLKTTVYVFCRIFVHTNLGVHLVKARQAIDDLDKELAEIPVMSDRARRGVVSFRLVTWLNTTD